MLLKNGSSGSYVTYLQYGLQIMCCSPGSMDGKFGTNTENAVKKYQGKKGLTQDGIVGDDTWNALVSDIKNIQTLLKNKGYYSGSIDGLAGTSTYNAVLQFQSDNGLTADGMVGSATLAALQGSSSTGNSKSILLPSDRKCTWKQQDETIKNLIGGSSSGCSLVAVLNAANIVGPDEFTPKEVLDACGGWIDGTGLAAWALPSNCAANLDSKKYTWGGKDSSTVFAAIRSGVNNNLPVIVRLNRTGNKSATHFVTAYGYTNGGKSDTDILVIDPNTGVKRTLAAAGAAVSKTVYGDYIPCVKR